MSVYEKARLKEESKSAIQKKETEQPVSSPNLTGIPDPMKARFENLSGFSFDDVRVHYNSDKPAQLEALAYTQDNQVYIAPGQEKHLGHELGHVVQQKEGNILPTTRVGGIPVNDNPTLETLADAMLPQSHSIYTAKKHSFTQRLQSVAQRKTYWPANAIDGDEPQTNVPQPPYFARDGDIGKQLLFNTSEAAEKSAKAGAEWDATKGETKTSHKGGGPSAGKYLYNFDMGKAYDSAPTDAPAGVQAGTPMAVNHDKDTNAKFIFYGRKKISSDTSVTFVDDLPVTIECVNHWHAAKSEKAIPLAKLQSDPGGRLYNPAGLIDHYYIKPNLSQDGQLTPEAPAVKDSGKPEKSDKPKKR